MLPLSIFFIILTILATAIAIFSFIYYRKLTKKPSQTIEETLPAYILKQKVVYDSMPIQPKKELAPHQYITVNGEEPQEPISIFHTKKFLAIAIPIGVFMAAYASYLLFFK